MQRKLAKKKKIPGTGNGWLQKENKKFAGLVGL